ncbi:MAG: YaiI/YqxD family protein [Oscillospiraceae bacterium]|nr:YaiI/YqxD family protein [Oscillospiraceae bacterium]
MTVLIDADGCPVVDITVKTANQAGIECVIICDTSHIFEKPGIKTVIVSKGNDSVDFALVNMAQKGDIVVTQDYGLAAMCLARGAVCVNQNGMIYSDGNIDSLLMQRYTSKKIRMSGGRTKGPAKRTQEQDKAFEQTLKELISG